MKISPKNDRGVALTVVMIVIILLVLLGGYMATLGFNQRKLVDAASGKRARVYYNAQAGVVDAHWRIRSNYTTGLVPAGSFADPNYDPNAYDIDVDGNGTADINVNIGPVGPTGLRTIDSIGLDV